MTNPIYYIKERERKQSRWVDENSKYFLPQVVQNGKTIEGFPKMWFRDKIHFSTPLTDFPEYTEEMKPTWNRICRTVRDLGHFVYAPFEHTDPYISQDNYSSYEIAFLDHYRVLESELLLFDLNKPSRGVGQEVEMGIFIPKIGFSKSRVSRLTKGTAGLLLLKYEDEGQLLDLIEKVLKQDNWEKDFFYVGKCDGHPVPSVFKGDMCLNCELKDYLHDPLLSR